MKKQEPIFGKAAVLSEEDLVMECPFTTPFFKKHFGENVRDYVLQEAATLFVGRRFGFESDHTEVVAKLKKFDIKVLVGKTKSDSDIVFDSDFVSRLDDDIQIVVLNEFDYEAIEKMIDSGSDELYFDFAGGSVSQYINNRCGQWLAHFWDCKQQPVLQV